MFTGATTACMDNQQGQISICANCTLTEVKTDQKTSEKVEASDRCHYSFTRSSNFRDLCHSSFTRSSNFLPIPSLALPAPTCPALPARASLRPSGTPTIRDIEALDRGGSGGEPASCPFLLLYTPPSLLPFRPVPSRALASLPHGPPPHPFSPARASFPVIQIPSGTSQGQARQPPLRCAPRGSLQRLG